MMAFLCEKQSKESFPWYAPMPKKHTHLKQTIAPVLTLPECPTPPNGSSLFVTCITTCKEFYWKIGVVQHTLHTSFTRTAPEEVLFIIVLASAKCRNQHPGYFQSNWAIPGLLLVKIYIPSGFSPLLIKSITFKNSIVIRNLINDPML